MQYNLHKIKAIPALFLVLFCTISTGLYSQTYTTINNGDWTDVTNVWSTNGTTACSCSPPFIINGNKIIIEDSINMDVDIDVN